ncbi:putative dithiol-disulfide isomerase involved in polyketide biosynthesis [Deinococcus peraridilitoris DSM 19664]|uniref:Putative dithiol-disulfide isomerase involved in polyketide biosynthesis n=1 Tax=Deinococcus peraridilitoris (strain DSM 19664 / LMG 22246 / CIP 109416 / KR-200) TaxID=937777 RepID=K9ZY44_DEIPD|nr:putative dithiol-disulfide isomerase involved in polyketide biosynthesis [Deinococcus peraridilitoris DSM 19664]
MYFDFLCPYAWRGLELVSQLGVRPQLKHFSLVQGNHAQNPDRKNPVWKLAAQPLTEGPDSQQASLRSFLAAQAARLQGNEAELQFTLQLLRLRHDGRRDLNDPQTAREAANQAGLDTGRFETDLADEASLRESLARDLNDAAQLGVFGTPTFVLPDGQAAYLRFSQLPADESAARRLWDTYVTVLTSDANIETIKRPR